MNIMPLQAMPLSYFLICYGNNAKFYGRSYTSVTQYGILKFYSAKDLQNKSNYCEGYTVEHISTKKMHGICTWFWSDGNNY